MTLVKSVAAIFAAAVLAGAPIRRTDARHEIQIDVGVVLDEDRNGRTIAAYGYEYDPAYSYISYRGTKAKPGNRVLTICWLTPGSEDDITARFDYILD